MVQVKRSFILLVIIAFCFTSCKFKLTYDQAGMDQLQQELTNKFGANAWYSEITLLSLSEKESAIRVKETSDPNSLKGKAWMKQADSWIPGEDIMFQFNDNAPENHLFQLNKQVSVDTLVALITRSKSRLQKSGIADASIHFVSIQSALTVKSRESRILYTISFQNQQDNKSVSFVYDLKGKLVSFNN